MEDARLKDHKNLFTVTRVFDDRGPLDIEIFEKKEDADKYFNEITSGGKPISTQKSITGNQTILYYPGMRIVRSIEPLC